MILLTGFALRVIRFTEAPPGLIHDETRNWLNSQLIRHGDIRPLYPYGGGREALYLLIQAASFQMIGDNLLAARLPSVAFSMIGIAASFSVARRLFGREAGLVAAAGLASSFWSLMFARLAVRTGSMPAMALLTTYACLRLLQAERSAIWRYMLMGVLLGATLYTYPSALVLPAILLTWIVSIALMYPNQLRGRWIGLAGSFVIAAVMAVPLARAWADPSTAARANEINAPLEALLAGDLGPTLANIGPVLGIFSVAGDHGLEFNVQDQPIFPTIPMAILFYLGLVWALSGLFRQGDRKRIGYGLALLWLVGMLVPTLVTEQPVNPSRTIGLLGIVYLFPAIATAHVREIAEQTKRSGLGLAAAAIVISGLLAQLGHTVQAYFTTWVENPVVKFLYQDEYRVLAADLPGPNEAISVAVGGLTPQEMDPVSLRLLAGREPPAAQVGYFDPQNSLLIPSPYLAGSTRHILIPNAITLHPVLARGLEAWGIRPESRNAAYACYTSEGPIPIEQDVEHGFIQPGEDALLVRFIQIEVVGPAEPGSSLTILSFWRVANPSKVPLRIFLHLTDQAGTILTQSDVLGVPSIQWRTGDVFIQAHDLSLPGDAPPGPYFIDIGLYDPVTGHRLIVETPPGGDHLHLALPMP